MGRIIPYILENKRCLKPPASHLLKITNIWGFLKSWWIPSPHRARAWISWIRPPWRRSKLHIDMGMCQNHPYLVGGFNLPLWKIWVSWDDYSIPNWMESHKIPWFQTLPNHQPVYIYHSLIIKNSMLEVVPIPWLFSPKTECQARHVMDSFTWGWRWHNPCLVTAWDGLYSHEMSWNSF